MNTKFRVAAALVAAVLLAALFVSGQAHAQSQSLPNNTATWTARYWNNTALSGTPVATQAEYGLSYSWGYGSPIPATIFADKFSARWETNLNFAAGQYLFTTVSDDGIRVWVDGTLIIDNWTWHRASTNTATITLAAGNHTVKVEYFEEGGEATVAVGWDNITTPPTPTPAPIANWRGEYFNNTTQSGTPALVRDDAAIDFDWGTGAPGPGVSANLFSVRWTRALSLDAGTYRFTMTVDDGGRLYLNDKLVIDRYVNQAATTYTYDHVHNGGTLNMKMEYYDNVVNAVARLSWQRIASPTTPTGNRVLEADTALNVRTGPGTQYRVIAVIYPGTKYAVLGSSGDWYQINFAGQAAYVYGPLTTVTSGSVNTPPPGQGVEATTTLNVRTGPGVSYAIIGVIRPGIIYQVTGSQSGWYRIDFNGQVGWVNGAFVAVR